MGCVPGRASGHCPCAHLLPQRSLTELAPLTGEVFWAQESSGPVLGRLHARYPALKDVSEDSHSKANFELPSVLLQESPRPPPQVYPPGCPFKGCCCRTHWARSPCYNYLSTPGLLRVYIVMKVAPSTSLSSPEHGVPL